MKTWLPELLAIARQAGKDIMAVYAGADFGTTSKADDSPLTLADLASHRTIANGLAALTPDIPVLSEEAADIAYSERSRWTKFWLVDPLDGTREFINRNGEFTVNIALIEDGQPVLGVVYAPALDVLYFGGEGIGAFVQRHKLPPQKIAVKQHIAGETIKVVASRSHSDERTQALLNRLGRYECVSMGSSLKLCLVAEGEAHFYPRLGPTMEWDTAAAHAVVNAAGGVVRDRGNRNLVYNKPDLHNPEFFVYSALDSRLPELLSFP
jgi:3'(2'), 5'-bisphosphate nucleotidase